MQFYTDRKSGNSLSILGFGCMRFPKENVKQTDTEKTEQLILNAVKNGINYFDTAFTYSGSEETLGQILLKNKLREKIFLATKLPMIKFRKYKDFNTVFQIQLEHLKTNYIDYYLLRNLSSMKLWRELNNIGIRKWIGDKKESGVIKNIGFSFHGIQNEFLQILDDYEWDFCQIQYNYLNINYQAGMTGLKKAYEKEVSVFVMEPLLGGKLADGLPVKAVKLFKSANSALTPAAWALRWLWNQKEVSVVLSGMNKDSQLEENIKIADNCTANMLNEKEKSVYESVIKIINSSYKIQCTGCNYCMPCPYNVNIPGCFMAYNLSFSIGMYSGVQQYLTSTGVNNPDLNYSPDNCRQCGECEKKCPQHIQIVSLLKKVLKRMESPLVKFVLRLLNK
ncbi:MAG: aldo/keto reductase [Treponema sp.]|nr:aldo/keto reductase [Treponema sp.]